MKLEHVALVINDPQEVEDFYKNLLGMSILKSFTLNRDLAAQLFGINNEAPVYLLKKNGLFLELFVEEETCTQNFRHICLSIPDREGFVEQTINKGYECIHLERAQSDLVFIKDKSGNIFEIKEDTIKQ